MMKIVSVLMVTMMIVLDPLLTQAYERKLKGDGKIVKTTSPKKLKKTKSPKGGSDLDDRKLKGDGKIKKTTSPKKLKKTKAPKWGMGNA